MSAAPTHSMHEHLEPVLSAAAMRAADQYTIEEYGIPGFALMESAGRGAVAAALARYGPPRSKRVLLLCGKGNNGGDGFVMARGFIAAGAYVNVLSLSEPESMTEDAARNYRLLSRLKAHLHPEQLTLCRYEERLLDTLPAFDLYVDALLGTGLTHALRDPLRQIVSWLNQREGPVLAVDLPTGLHTDYGTQLEEAVRADLTVTMGALKTGLVINDGPACAGAVVVAEIGIPQHALMGRTANASSGVRATDAYVRARLPRRGPTAHKYNVGLTLALAGSPGLTGAPIMAATAAARIGSGAVVVACHEAVQPVLASRLTEIMTLTLPGNDGAFDVPGALQALSPRLEQARALLIGCGLGRAEGTAELVRRLCEQTHLPLVLDADGLNAFAGHTDLIRKHAGGRWVLTPHVGELRRLAGDVSLEDRLSLVRKLSADWNCILLLKGMPSVIGTPDGKVFVCKTGNPALATAGTGDVLAGIIAGLLAQGLSPEDAAVCGAHIGGAAADAFTAKKSARSMQAMDLVEALPKVLRTRFE